MQLALALVGCGCVGDDVDTAGWLPDEVALGPEVVCENPISGFDRFTEEGLSRGLDLDIEPVDQVGGCNYVPSNVSAHDVDGDGDADLLFNRPDGFPHVYLNDRGQFTSKTINRPVESAYGREVLAFATVDLTGDGLPEVVVVGEDLVLWSENTGGATWSDWQVILDEPEFPRVCISSMAFGDVDGDGDLDLALPGLDEVLYDGFLAPGKGEWLPTDDRLYLNDGGSFRAFEVYSPEPGFSITTAFTDRDNDGDLDLLAGTDRPFDAYPPMAFLRNDGNDDGGPILVNDAPELEADLRVSAMGLGVHDMNGDGLLDYCMTDLSFQLTCLFSVEGSAYYEGGAAMGLVADLTLHPDIDAGFEQRLADGDFGTTIWASWGLAMLDLDNDARLDVVATAGPPPDYGSVYSSDIWGFQPDWIWQGTDDGFETRINETGFHSIDWSYGIATADFDGDGYRDFVLGPSEGNPPFWSNACGEGSWLEVELVGKGDNVEAYGARVEFTANGETQVQEMHNLQAVSQSVSRLHFGLGKATSGELTVRFVDGSTVSATVPVNRLVTVSQP